MSMDTDGRLTTVIVLRGSEFTVGLSLNDNDLTIDVEDRATCDQWRNTFDSTYIEDVTFKTGNFKKFPVFAEMLLSAVNKTSDAVTLDLLSYADLELLREQKAGGVRNVSSMRTSSAGSNNKKYLIVTYSVEFDRVHYPLPLLYVGKADPQQLQNMIQKLKQDIKALKQQNTKDYRIKEVELLKRDCDKLLKEKEALQLEYLDFKRQVELTTEGTATKEIRMLKSMVKNLEEELATSRVKYQHSSSRKKQEIQRLTAELEEVKASERTLKIRVKSLTNELAQYKRQGSRAFPAASSRSSRRPSHNNNNNNNSSNVRDRSHSGSRQNSFSRASNSSMRSSVFSQNHSFEKNQSRLSNASLRSRERSLSSDRSTLRARNSNVVTAAASRGSISSRPRSISRERERSLSNSSRNSLSAGVSRMRILSPAGARYPRFDPTAYNRERDRRRQEIELKQKRSMRVRMSGSIEREKRDASPAPSWSSIDFLGNERRPSRNSSIGSLASSIESLSEAGMRSEAYSYRQGQRGKVLKSAEASLTSVDAWNGSKHTHDKQSTKPTNKVLSSTPENVVRTRSRFNHEKQPQHGDRKDHSFELSEIDERLSRLQQFMKENLQ